MHRPKKNKNSDPLMPEDNIVDERNLIDMEDAAELSIEDRISMYWMENKGFIIGCISALALALVAFNGMRIYKEHALESLANEFAAADASDSLADFADANSNKSLGGFAAMATADAAYTEGDYAKALEYYQVASSSLKGTVLAGRAMLGEAFALYQSRQEAEGIAKLNAIAADSSIAESSRAEAAYHLALEADFNGDSEAFEAYAAQINESTLAGPWQQRLSFHQQSR